MINEKSNVAKPIMGAPIKRNPRVIGLSRAEKDENTMEANMQ
jgi:hypothetical protein